MPDIIQPVQKKDINFSVVIPALNEEKFIAGCIDNVKSVLPGARIIVADGGSTDGTPSIARDAGATLIPVTATGRGQQCNAGAEAASGDVILFLHADTRLPEQTEPYLESMFRDRGVSVGTFILGFNRRHWLLTLISRFTRVYRGHLRFGDSVITVRKSFFQSLGGFPNQRLFEDYEFLRKASRHTRIYRFPLEAVTSTRRFDRVGPIRQSVKNAWLILRYITGTPPDRLAALYENETAPKARLLMMCRLPEPGKVKTRLAADIGNHRAAAVYRRCAEALFTAADNLPGDVDKTIFAGSAADIPGFRGWTGNRFTIMAQPEADLGKRLNHGFAVSFNRGYEKVIAVASDVPSITGRILKESLDALDRHDAVIGPSPDGGYYLIGLKRPVPALFTGIPWSTPDTLAETERKAKNLGLSMCRITALPDIDTIADLNLLENGLPDAAGKETDEVFSLL